VRSQQVTVIKQNNGMLWMQRRDKGKINTDKSMGGCEVDTYYKSERTEGKKF